MEFAAAALTAVTSAGSAAAAGGTAAAASSFSLASLIPSVSTAASILSGGATVLSVLNANREGEAKAKALNLQADDAIIQTQIETLQGIDRRSSLKAAYAKAMGDRDVATAASGVDLSFGTAAIARKEATADTERALSIDEETTNSRVARLKERAANYRIQAEQARAGGLAKAAGLALEGGAKLLNRG
jgi:hypothetical protein